MPTLEPADSNACKPLNAVVVVMSVTVTCESKEAPGSTGQMDAGGLVRCTIYVFRSKLSISQTSA